MTLKAQSNPPQPGCLFAPFGWAAQALAQMLAAAPELAGALLQISRARMHLIALALAHCDGPKSAASTLQLLLRGSFADVLCAVLPSPPRGLARALERLPAR